MQPKHVLGLLVAVPIAMYIPLFSNVTYMAHNCVFGHEVVSEERLVDPKKTGLYLRHDDHFFRADIVCERHADLAYKEIRKHMAKAMEWAQAATSPAATMGEKKLYTLDHVVSMEQSAKEEFDKAQAILDLVQGSAKGKAAMTATLNSEQRRSSKLIGPATARANRLAPELARRMARYRAICAASELHRQMVNLADAFKANVKDINRKEHPDSENVLKAQGLMQALRPMQAVFISKYGYESWDEFSSRCLGD